MSIGLQCSACGRRYRVADDRQGTTITCQCGQPIVARGVHYADKLCAACGIDVSSLTRTRDPHGNYYCQPCWDEALKAKRQMQSQKRDADLAWITRQLSRLRFGHAIRPLIVLAIIALLVLSWYQPQTGKIGGATLLVLGGAMLAICTVWLYVAPFRDGPAVGFRCLLSGSRRRQWAQQNPEFNLWRPASLVMMGLWIMLLSAAFFAVWVAALQHRGQW